MEANRKGGGPSLSDTEAQVFAKVKTGEKITASPRELRAFSRLLRDGIVFPRGMGSDRKATLAALADHFEMRATQLELFRTILFSSFAFLAGVLFSSLMYYCT